MRALILVTCLLAAGALARPEAGYSYNGLQRGLPKDAHQLKPHVHQQLPAEHSFANFAASPQMTYLAPLAASVAPALAAPVERMQQQQQQHLVASMPPNIEDIPQPSQPLPLAQQQLDDSYNMAYQHSSMHSHESSGYAYTPQQTTIHKHIYVHVPPKDFDDEDVITPVVRHQAAPKQKHYKIVFIKAPAAPSVRPPVVPPPPQNEEKTLIYVLHKKPEVEQDIIIPTAAPTKPSKPEVYFIKYKTKKEEAPVYGPPPPPPPPQHQEQHQHHEEQPVFLDMEPRHIEVPSGEYGAPMGAVDDFIAAPAPNVAATLTTMQPQAEVSYQPQQQQFGGEAPVEVYDAAPTLPAIVTDEPKPTLAAMPSNQYLAPEAPQTMAPIVVEDTHVPSSKYGPPNRFFLKKKK